MSTSNHPENSTHKPATPPQKKEELATSTPTASTEAASAPSMPSMPELAATLFPGRQRLRRARRLRHRH